MNLHLLAMINDGKVVPNSGGEILTLDITPDYITPFCNWHLVNMYSSIPLLLLIMFIVGCIVLVLVRMKLHNIKSLDLYGITRSISIRNREIRNRKALMNINQFISDLTMFVEKTPFRVNVNNKDYMDYNLKMAGFTLPGNRPMYYETYNALKLLITFILILFAVFIGLFASLPVGILLIIGVIWLTVIMPIHIIRAIVQSKNRVIRENFMDFYLMLHYSILTSSTTPLTKLMLSYTRTTDNVTMIKFVSECINHIDTYGEYNATGVIAKEFREVPQVGKLMRLIKQKYDGADVNQELIGFRKEVINETKARINDEGDKRVVKVRSTIYLVYIMCFQILVSIVIMYLGDMKI